MMPQRTNTPTEQATERTDRRDRFARVAESMYLRLGKWPLVAEYTGIPVGAFMRRRTDCPSEERLALLEQKQAQLFAETAPATEQRPEPPRPVELLGQALRSQVMDITVELAMQWLEERAPNRNVSDRVVAGYARDMRAGKWRLNGEAIIFDRNGRLKDGQHRLWAVIESGMPIQTVVVQGVDPDVMETIDSGRKRTFADALQIDGHSNTRSAASASRWMAWEQRGCSGKLGTYTPSEMRAALEAHPTILEAASLVSGSRAGGLVTQGLLTWVLARALEQDRARALDWLEQLNSGVGLHQRHPCYLLRERLIADKGAKRRLDQIVVAAYVVKSWIAYRDDREIAHLRWAPDKADRPERFPPLDPGA